MDGRTQLAELLQFRFMNRARAQVVVHGLHKTLEEIVKSAITFEPFEPQLVFI